eukprot:7389606-Prymnesium_polylepis.2
MAMALYARRAKTLQEREESEAGCKIVKREWKPVQQPRQERRQPLKRVIRVNEAESGPAGGS